MGWGSAVKIMDLAVEAAEAAVRAALESVGEEPQDSDTATAMQNLVDEALRPFVRTLASELHDGDWDTERDSEFFDRFPQEMLGQNDREHLAWLIDQVVETGAAPEWIEKLTAFRAKTGLVS